MYLYTPRIKYTSKLINSTENSVSSHAAIQHILSVSHLHVKEKKWVLK